MGTPDSTPFPDRSQVEGSRSQKLRRYASIAGIGALFIVPLAVIDVTTSIELSLSIVFVLAMACFGQTWWFARRTLIPNLSEDALRVLVNQFGMLMVFGWFALCMSAPDLALSTGLAAWTLGVVAYIAIALPSLESFLDFTIMLLAGIVVPQAAITLGVPDNFWTRFLLALLVAVPLGVYLFNKGPSDIQIGQTVAPLLASMSMHLVGAPEPKVHLGYMGFVLLFFISLRVYNRLFLPIPGTVRAAVLIFFLTLLVVALGAGAAHDAAGSLPARM